MTAGYRIGIVLLAGLVFAGVGAVLSLLICLLLRAMRPGLSRRAVLATVAVGVPLLIILLIALMGLAVRGEFSLSFLLAMRMEAWVCVLMAEVAALLLARRLAPAPPLKVDPSTFA